MMMTKSKIHLYSFVNDVPENALVAKIEGAENV
jgi:hypothetical protein